MIKTYLHILFVYVTIPNRYDALVEDFWKVARAERDNDNAELKCNCLGFSMSLERMAAILKKMETEVPNTRQNSEVGTMLGLVSEAKNFDP